MKRIALLLPALLGTYAFADSGDTIVVGALTDLRTHAWFQINLSGTEVTGTKQRTFQSTFWWQSTGAGTANALTQLACREWWDGVLTEQTVGDGTNLWAYDPVRNQYTVSTYGSYAGLPPAGYVRNLIEGFKVGATGSTQYLARLLSNTFAPGGVQYTPWMLPALAGEVGGSEVGVGYVRYKFGDPVYRWIRFSVSQDDAGDYSLTGFDLFEVRQIGSETRTTTWTATVDTTTTPPPSTFVFAAPTNARPIATPHQPSG